MNKATLFSLKRYRKWFLAFLIISSVILIAFNATQINRLTHHLSTIAWIGMCLLITEAFFIVGVLLMAISAGENLSEYRQVRQWRRGVSHLRKHSRSFAEQLITSRLFTIGFWLNFLGAVGTSVILITGLITVTSYAGVGILVILVIDLFATFGWRIPVELTRRKVKKHGRH